jgi:predicted PurR-regulated permease PerM
VVRKSHGRASRVAKLQLPRSHEGKKLETYEILPREPAQAGTHLRWLVRHRPVSSGGPQPGGPLGPATSQADQAQPRHIAHLPRVVALLFMVGILLPVLVDQIQDLINFVASVANAPEGPTQHLKGLAQQYGLGWVFERFSDQLGDIRSQLGKAARNVLLSSGDVIVSAAGFVAALVTILTITFFLILGGERYLSAGVGLFAEPHRPLVRRLLTQSAGAVTGYVRGNLAISAICGVTTFVVLVVLGMPYAAALAVLVAVLDLIPLVGATLGGALLVIVGLFVAPWKAMVLLIHIVVYQQVEGSGIQPMVYSHAVQLSGLVIFIAILVGGLLLGIPGALLAIPVVEIIRIVVSELVAYRRTRQEANKPAASPQSQLTT